MRENWWNPMAWDAPFAVVAAALYVIVLARASATCWVGHLLRRGSEHGRARRLVDSPEFAAAAARINRWGPPAVTLSFLTVGVQTMVNLVAGFTRMPLRHYVPALLLGCLAWALIYASAGFIGLRAVARLWAIHPGLGIALVVVAALALLGWLRLQRSRPAPTAPFAAAEQATD